MVHPWAILHSPVRRQEWWRKITYFSPQILQTYRVEMPIFLIPSYTHQLCSVMIKLLSYSIFFLCQTANSPWWSYWVTNKQDRAPQGLQTKKIISWFISCQKPLHFLPNHLGFHSNKIEMFIYSSLKDGHFDRLLYGLHALFSTDFVTDSAASYTTSYTGIRQNFFSCKNTLIVSHRKWYKEGQDFVSKRTQLFLIKNPYNTLPWN